MRYSIKGLGAALALGFAISSVSAQAPGYDETAAYIIERCNDRLSYRGGVSGVDANVLISDMRFDGPTWRWTYKTDKEGFAWWRQEIEVDLKNILRTDTVDSLGYTTVIIICLSGSECITEVTKISSSSGFRTRHLSSQNIACRQNDRVANAILRMHELAGPADDDPFAD